MSSVDATSRGVRVVGHVRVLLTRAHAHTAQQPVSDSESLAVAKAHVGITGEQVRMRSRGDRARE